MPAPVLKSFAKKSGLSLDKLEQYWDSAQKYVQDELKMAKEDDKFYAAVVGTIKHWMRNKMEYTLIDFKKMFIEAVVFSDAESIYRKLFNFCKSNVYKKGLAIDDIIKKLNALLKQDKIFFSLVETPGHMSDTSVYGVISAQYHSNVNSIQILVSPEFEEVFNDDGMLISSLKEIQGLLEHEMVHQNQLKNVPVNKAKQVELLMRSPDNNKIKLPQEVMAYAHDFVNDLKKLGYAKENILFILKNTEKENARSIMWQSDSYLVYHIHYASDSKLKKLFWKYVAEYLEKGETK